MSFDPFAGGAMLASGPTTDAQREVLTAARFSPEANLAYNEGTRLVISGVVDIARLEQALATLYQRHESLRMTFSRDNEAFFVWDRHLTIERQAAPYAEGEARLHAVIQQVMHEPFNVDEGPLFRAIILERAPDRLDLLLLAHHLVCDGWSLSILTEELLTLYREPAVVLPEAPSYVTYATRAHGATDEATVEYWRRQFSQEPPKMEIPSLHARAAARVYRAARLDLPVSASVVDSMKKLSARNQATLFGGLLAGAMAMFSRLCGEDDVVLAVPAAGQAASGMTRLVGHCVNVLPIRASLDPRESVGAFVARIGSLMFDAQEHQEFTIGRLLRTVAIPRVSGHVPVTPVMFNVDQGLQLETLLAGTGLSAEAHTMPRASEYFELFLNLVQHQGKPLVIECQYNAHLFSESQIREWLEAYVAVLEQMTSDALAPVGALVPIAPGTRAHLDGDWQGRRATSEFPLLVHEWIALVANRHADTVAAVDASSALTYADLKAQSLLLASQLQRLGAGPGHRVAISVSRTSALPVALLGVLVSGAAYVPVDLDYPPERLRMMLEDSAPVAWVVDGPTPDALAGIAIPRVDLSTLDGSALGAFTPVSMNAHTDPAYVIYTSGSTGKPKGVVVQHAAVTNFLAAMCDALPVTADDRFLALTTLSFDIAGLELLLPLVLGARTCVVDRATARDPRALTAAMDRFGVSVAQATPSTWRSLVDDGWAGRRSMLALCGGEPLPAELASRLAARVGSLWNVYGPTETTIWSTVKRIEPDATTISIGRPILNTHVEVVDSRDRRTAVGVAGEILIGGHGVALGYLERPALTSERFVVHPLFGEGRAYRTGDLGMWGPDGALVHLGRIDDQVKVRGFRIELGEIESILAMLPEVKAAAARVWDFGQGDARIAAYLVSSADAAPSAESILRQVRSMLPEHMVPQFIMFLDALPRTPNAKLDRKALPFPVVDTGDATDEDVWSPTEMMVAEVWQDVLGVPVNRRTADFFALGGHSILVARAVGRLEQRLGVSIGLRRLFETTRLDAFAASLPAPTASAQWEELTL